MKTIKLLKQMKTIKLLAIVLLTSIVFTSCKKDDPAPVNEEEVITTMTVTLSPDAGGTDIVLKSLDIDGDGPGTPVITVSGNLTAGATYNGSIVLLNETVNPAENVTLEVIDENTEHQFFYTPGAGLDVATSYANFDDNGNNFGTQFTLVAGAAGTGNLTVTLIHQPTKPNTGLTDAGGETDFEATFPVTIE